MRAEREVEITLLRAAAMDVWNAVPLGVVLPPEYVQAINRLGCAIRGEWHLLAPVASPVAAIGKAKESVLKELKKASFSPEGGMTRRQLREVVTGRPGTVDEAVQELYRASEIYHEPSAKKSDVQVWKVYALPQVKT